MYKYNIIFLVILNKHLIGICSNKMFRVYIYIFFNLSFLYNFLQKIFCAYIIPKDTHISLPRK